MFVLQTEPQAMTSWAQTLFVTEFLYGLLIPLEKTSILLLYLRLFRVHRWFRLAIYGLIAYIWMWGVSETLVSVFQCSPVEHQWVKAMSGTCIDELAYYRWISVPNVAHDVVMLFLPLPMVWSLQIDGQKKLALTSVFLMGSM